MAKKQPDKKLSKRAQLRVKRHKKQRLIWVSIAILVLIALSSIILITNGRKTETLSQTINVSQAYKEYTNGVLFLDVRSQEEWDELHIPNTNLIPLDQLPDRISELPTDQKIVVVCRSGNRSKLGRNILIQAGFNQVSTMEGGLNAWREAGYPTK